MRKPSLGNSSSYEEIICQRCQEVVRDSKFQIWQAHTDENRTSCSQEHRKTYLVSVFYEVTSEGRECLSHPRSSHHCDLQQPQLQFRILHERLNLRWKSAFHQMLLISCRPQALHDDQLQSPLPLPGIQF